MHRQAQDKLIAITVFIAVHEGGRQFCWLTTNLPNDTNVVFLRERESHE